MQIESVIALIYELDNRVIYQGVLTRKPLAKREFQFVLFSVTRSLLGNKIPNCSLFYTYINFPEIIFWMETWKPCMATIDWKKRFLFQVVKRCYWIEQHPTGWQYPLITYLAWQQLHSILISKPNVCNKIKVHSLTGSCMFKRNILIYLSKKVWFTI